MDWVQTSIYCRKLKKSITWYVKWKDPKSGAYKIKTVGRDKAEALLVESRVREALFRGEAPFPSRLISKILSLSEMETQYYQSPRFMSVCLANRKNCQTHLRGLLNKFGKFKIDELNQTQILSLYSELKRNGRSSRTIHKYHFNYSLFGDFVCELSGVEKNPFRQVKVRKYFPNESSTRDINFLLSEEISGLIGVLRRNYSPLIWRFAQFLANTGLRRSEAYRLKWSDIDFESGFIIVRISKNKRTRMVPLEPLAIQALSGLSRAYEYVFTREDGSRFHIDSFIAPVQESAKKAGSQKRIDIHTFRHSYGSNKIRMGWGIKKVSQILGHSDIQLTASYYSHLLDGDLKIRDECLAQQPSKGLEEATRLLVAALLDERGRGEDGNLEISDAIVKEAMRRIHQSGDTKLNQQNDSKDLTGSLENQKFDADTLQISNGSDEKKDVNFESLNYSMISGSLVEKVEPMIPKREYLQRLAGNQMIA